MITSNYSFKNSNNYLKYSDSHPFRSSNTNYLNASDTCSFKGVGDKTLFEIEIDTDKLNPLNIFKRGKKSKNNELEKTKNNDKPIENKDNKTLINKEENQSVPAIDNNKESENKELDLEREKLEKKLEKEKNINAKNSKNVKKNKDGLFTRMTDFLIIKSWPDQGEFVEMLKDARFPNGSRRFKRSEINNILGSVLPESENILKMLLNASFLKGTFCGIVLIPFSADEIIDILNCTHPKQEKGLQIMLNAKNECNIKDYRITKIC